MHRRSLFDLLTLPAVTASLLAVPLMATTATAVESTSLSTNLAEAASCDAPAAGRLHSMNLKQGVLIASAAGGGIADDADFSIAESDAAATLFGCDCPACIRALRQLQLQSLTQQVTGSTGKSKGHCSASLQRRQVSPQVIQETLKTLEGSPN
jgi:hypothetical protein